eukprot:228427_1
MSKNKFCCAGYIMFGVDFKYFICTNILIIIPSIIQWIYIINKYFYFELILSIILFIFTYTNLFKASFTDPGYLPTGNEIIPPSHQQLKPNGSKFCGTCKIWRPPRA